MAKLTNRPEIHRQTLGAESFGIVQKPLTIFERIYNQGWLRKLFVLAVIAAAWEIYAQWLGNALLVPTLSIWKVAAGLLGGISEPSLYGIHLRFKRIYPRMLVGCLVGGLIIGIGGGVIKVPVLNAAGRLEELRRVVWQNFARLVEKTNTEQLLPDGLAVLAAWGFHYKSNIVWHKIRKDGGSDGRGVGFYFRNVTELLLFGVKGKNARTLQPGRTQVAQVYIIHDAVTA